MTDKDEMAVLVDSALLFDRAMEQAFIAQFCLLFSVLMQAEDLEQGVVRFQRGLTKLMNTGAAAAEVIRTMENG